MYFTGCSVMPSNTDTVPCPYCGEAIKKNAPACPFCGSDEQTGWSDSTYLDDIDLPGENEYEELVQNEFPEKSNRPKKFPWIAIAGALVLACFIAAMLGLFR
jgi:hypothetical protein